MTTPLHKILRCFNPPRNSLKPLEGLRRKPAPPHCNTPSRHPLNHDDASSQRSLGFDTATGQGTQGLQQDVPKASSNTHVLLCEVNRQTPISKRGGVRSLFLNLCREAWDCGVAPKASLRAQRPGLKLAKSLGLDSVAGDLANRKFASGEPAQGPGKQIPCWSTQIWSLARSGQSLSKRGKNLRVTCRVSRSAPSSAPRESRKKLLNSGWSRALLRSPGVIESRRSLLGGSFSLTSV